MTLRLLLIRHGLSSYNCENRIQGRNDLSTLTAEGLSQASKAGQALKEVSIEAVYSSPLQRAADTAKELIKERSEVLDIAFKNDLMEVDLPQWSGLTIEEVKDQFPTEYLIWEKDPNELILNRKDGTSFKPIKDLFNQAEKFLKELFEIHNPSENKNILIVGHNAILRCLIMQLLNQPKQGIRRIKLDNASISTLKVSPSEQKNYSVQIESLNSTAHLKTELPTKGKNPRIILVRHGETDWNREGRFQGQIDIPLNDNGKAQAKAARTALKEVLIHKAYSSSMTRPLETAQIILSEHPGININLEKELIEINHGQWEGKLEAEVKSNWGELLDLWKESPEKVQMPNGESVQDVWDRAVKCWERISKSLSSNETALIVAHDAVNKTILCHLLGLTPENIWMVKQGNGGITVIDISMKDNQPHLISCMNITSHLGGVFDQTAHGAL